MKLHELRLPMRRRRARRVGRGGKRGTTSGRGQKGQKSRAGRRIRKAERDLILRLPKRRGFRNKPRTPQAVVVSLRDLGRFSGVVDYDTLANAGLVRKGRKRRVKILGNGEIANPLTIKGLLVSRQAKMKIEKAGGTVQPV